SGSDSSFDALASLVDQSLVRQDHSPDGEPRFRMLETIRAYAWERLAESGETGVVEREYAGYYLALAEKAEAELPRPRQVTWLNRLEQDHDNIQAVLTLCARDDDDGVFHELGLRLAVSLGWFWYVRGPMGQGRAWLERFARLTRANPAAAATRARALGAAG